MVLLTYLGIKPEVATVKSCLAPEICAKKKCNEDAQLVEEGHPASENLFFVKEYQLFSLKSKF